MRPEHLLPILALLLAGCAPSKMRGDGPPQVCGDALAQHYLGQPGEAGVIEGARRASKARVVRVVRPGEMMTMDFRADRLTVTVDEHRRISQLRCG